MTDAPLPLETHLPDALPHGTILHDGAWCVRGELGRGGFGITYRATGRDGHEVAIKEFFPAGCSREEDDFGALTLRVGGLMSAQSFERARTQFVEGARILSDLRHASIVGVDDCFLQNGTAYLVMELLHGQTLAEMVERDGPLASDAARQIIAQVGEALDAIHRIGFLHLDIKPENIMLCDDEMMKSASQSTADALQSTAEALRVVVFDFDLLQKQDLSGGYRTRPLISHCGTPGYAPLEQYTQRAQFGPFTDLYALGATFYHLLTGHAPPAATDRAHDEHCFVPPRRWRPDLDEKANDAVLWALEMAPHRRPADARQWLQALHEGRVAPVVAPTANPAPLDDADANDADFLANAALAPTMASAAGAFAMPAGASIAGAPSLRRSVNVALANANLALLPQVEGWFRVAIRDLDVQFPVVCACCGGRADVTLIVKSPGHRWTVPYCARCRRHTRVANQAVSGTICGLGLGFFLALGGWLLSDLWLSSGGIIFEFSTMAYGVLKVQSAEAIMRSRCCERKIAVAFGGQSHARYFVHFRSLSYAHKFRELNALKIL